MADAQPHEVRKRLERYLTVGIGLGVLFIAVSVLAFWVLFIKPLEFAGTAAMHGLGTGQSGAVIEKFDVTINAKGERMVVGNDPQKILEALKQVKPASAPVTDSKPPSP